MTDELAPISTDNIPTLLEQKVNGLVIVAFCPICDRTEEAGDDGLGREHVAAAAVAKIKLHIRREHPPKSHRTQPKPISRRRRSEK